MRRVKRKNTEGRFAYALLSPSLLLLIPINKILIGLTNIAALKAILPAAGGAALVAISVFLTFIAGLIPSGMAARKDPVVALRTE